MTTLYHYCSSTVFESIISNQEIWLSSMAQSNDLFEGQIVRQRLLELADRNHLNQVFQDNLQAGIETWEEVIVGLAFCLSAQADLLSQWRAYTENGTGVSIGFSRSYLDWLVQAKAESNLKLVQVEYDAVKQRELVDPVYQSMVSLIQSDNRHQIPHILKIRRERISDPQLRALSGRIGSSPAMLRASIHSMGQLYRLKHEAFVEESEWRLLELFELPYGGVMQHRVRGGSLIPYKAHTLLEPQRYPIKCVVLGPKNPTPISVVEYFLSMHGFSHVDVRRSEVPYR